MRAYTPKSTRGLILAILLVVSLIGGVVAGVFKASAPAPVQCSPATGR